MKQFYFIAVVALAFCVSAISPVTAQQASSYETEDQPFSSYKDFRVAVGGGYAYRLGKIEETSNPEIDDMNKKLRNGYVIDAEAQYFFRESWGVGLNANLCTASTSGSGFTLPGLDQTIDSYDETQRCLYVGPAFAARSESDRFLLVTSIGIGPLVFMDDITIDGVEMSGNKTTVGINAGFSGEYKMNNRMGLGLKLSYTMGTINSINFEGQNIPSDEKINVSNLIFTVFLSFRSW
jgi:opacity protein-like surface antigen